MHVAGEVEMRHARRQLVGARLLHPARLAVGGRGDDAPVGHVGLALGLAVDRPGGAVIVRAGILGARIDMAADGEAQIGILVQHLTLLGSRHAEAGGHEILVAQGLLGQKAHLLLALRTGIGGQRRADIGRELMQRIGHGGILRSVSWSAIRIG